MVKKWYNVVSITICFLLAFTLTANVAMANKQDIRFYINDQYVSDIVPIVKSGVMYVPLRKVLNHFGYKVQYDQELNGVYANHQQFDKAYQIYYSLDEDFNGSVEVFTRNEKDDYYYYYYLDQTAIVMEGVSYFPIRPLAFILGYSISYNQLNQDANMLEYGFGEQKHIEQLIKKYNLTNSVDLLTGDHYERHYSSSYNNKQKFDWPKIMKDPCCTVTIDSIDFTAANQARLIATITKDKEIFSDYKVGIYDVRKENGQWLIAASNFIKSEIKLTTNLDENALTIAEQQNEKQQAILNDLRAYYDAINEENVERTIYYTSPSFIKERESGFGEFHWKLLLEASFEMNDVRYTLSNEKVVSINEDKAVVHASLKWQEGIEMVTYPVLIDMVYANGHWNYSYEFDLQANNYDRTEDFFEKE